MRIHTFDNTVDAYNDTQTLESIEDGDVLVVPSENVVGILFQAWPVAVTRARGEFHRFASDDLMGYASQVQDAQDVARVIGAPIHPSEVVVVAEDNTPRCTCEWADDDGDPEVGPDPYIAEVDPDCPVHKSEYEAARREGYCKHGVYVGGCGIDWMCGRCEMGE
jgi:hypothetical protein